MKLLLKFNLIFILLVGSGLVLVSKIAYDFLEQNARAQVLQQAQLMMDGALATREYTSEELTPLLTKLPQHETEFIPQSVPSYGATQSFSRLRKKYPDYTYREPSLNPTNLRNRAEEFEADVINVFRNHPERKEIVGKRNTPTGAALYLAHPIQVKESCLKCHDVAAKAPASLIRSYGPNNGFGWKTGEVIGAQIVSVPLAVPISIAETAYQRLLFYLVLMFVLALVAIDTALYFVVIRPVRKLAAIADRVSRGDLDVPEIPIRGNDEIAALTGSFNRMYVTVVKALRLLNT